jgi:CheY-like chemotaxis protein
MSKSGPIVIVEDDADDKEIFEMALKELSVENEIVWFTDPATAYHYLQATTEVIFLIFCDINLPGKSGMEFKRDIDSNPELRKKSIPFIFMSTTASQKDVNDAYTKMVVQGFFKKETDYNAIKKVISSILEYWRYCKHPNSV